MAEQRDMNIEDMNDNEINREDMDIEEAEGEELEEENQEGNDCPETEEAGEADTEDGAADQAGSEETTGKKLFKKKNKADKRQDALKQKIEELEDRVKRQMAEFDNFRKRTDKEKTAMYEIGAKSVIEKILPVVDNFERGLASVPEEEKGNGFADGMQMIYKQLMTELENIGVKPIEAIGQEFDPDYHNAVMQVESEEYETGIVAQVQKAHHLMDHRQQSLGVRFFEIYGIFCHSNTAVHECYGCCHRRAFNP